MTVISDSIRSVSGVPDDRQITFSSTQLRDGSDSSAIVSTVLTQVFPVEGEFSVDLDPGPAEAVIRNQKFKFVVPESGPSRLWPLIEDYVPVAAPVVNEAAAARDAAQGFRDDAQQILDDVAAGAVPDAGVASQLASGTATRAAATDLIEEVGGAAFAPVDIIGTKVTDAVQEWWIHPLSTYDAARNRTIGGGLSADKGAGISDVVVWERNHGTGKVRRYVIGTAPTDDHNVPSVLLLPNGQILVTWNYHGVDKNLRGKVSNIGGDLRTLVSATEWVSNIAYDISYTQAHVVSGTAGSATFVVWDFVRLYRGDGFAWEIIPLTITASTGGIEKGATLRFISGATNQAYASTAWDPATSRIRVLAGFNPAASMHQVHCFEIDPATGAVTSLGNPALTANVTTQTNVPISLVTETPALANTGTGASRRIFYPRPGPASWAFVYAEWADTNNPQNGHYYLRERASADAANGMKSSAGYASTPNNNTLFDDLVNGFQYTWVGKFDSVPAGGDREVGRRYIGVGDRQFYLRVTTAGKMKTQITRAPDAALDITSTAAIPSYTTALVAKIGLRLKLERIGGTNNVSFYYSTDTTNGTDGTWNLLEAAVTAGTSLLFDSTAPLIVGAGASTVQQGIITYAHELRNSTGAVVSAVDWTNKAQDTPTVTDPQGNVFTLNGDANVWSTTPAWTLHDLGLTGPRVGYTNLANYIGGAGFRTPCYAGDPVLVARRNAGDTGSTLEEMYYLNGVWVSEILDQTSGKTQGDGYFMRPSGPVGRGPLASVHTEITHYTDVYTEYQGNLRTS